MPDTKWPKMIYNSARIKNLKLSAIERARNLCLIYNCLEHEANENLSGFALLKAHRKWVYDKVENYAHEEWINNMKRKSSLTRYRAHKQKRGTIDHIYDNSRGSTLLAEARAGFLKTRKFRSRFEEIEPDCTTCGREETLEHVLLECLDETDSDIEIQKKLGLHEDSTREIINETKRILERWEKHSR